MNIAKRITELRESQGLSMRKLAERSGLSQPFISGIEAGDKQPTLDSLLKLASGLGLSLIELLGGDPLSESLPEHLASLLKNARHLDTEQVEAINQLIKTMTKSSATTDLPEECFDPAETLAAHRVGNPMDDLPPEAWDSIKDFKRSYKKEMKNKDKK